MKRQYLFHKVGSHRKKTEPSGSSALNDKTRSQTRVPPEALPPHLSRNRAVNIPTLLISTLLVGSLIIVLSFLGFAKAVSNVFSEPWSRLNYFVILIRVEVRWKENLEEVPPYILAENNKSFTDICVL